MPKIFLVLFFILFALPGFAQEDNDGGGGRVIIRETPPSETHETAPAAEIIPNEDEVLIQEAEAARLKRMEQVKAIEVVTAPIAEAKNPIQQIQELGHKQLDAAALMDDRVVVILQDTIRSGAMAKSSDEETKKFLKDKAKGTWAEGLLRRFPKLLSITADIVRSKEAMPGLLGIMLRKEDLKTYGYIWLGIFIFGLFIKGRLVKPKWEYWRRFRWKFTISLILSCLNFGIFYFFFSEELAPTFEIIGKHLF